MGKKKDKKKGGNSVMMDENGNVFATNEREMRDNYDKAAAEQREKQNKYNAAHAKAEAAEADWAKFDGDPDGKKMERMMAAFEEEKQAKKELDQAKYNTDFAFAAFQHDGKGGWQFNEEGQKAFVEEQNAKKEWNDTFNTLEGQRKDVRQKEAEQAKLGQEKEDLKNKYFEAKDAGKTEEAADYRQQYLDKNKEYEKKEKEVEDAKAERTKTNQALKEKTSAYSAAHEKSRKTKIAPKKKTALETFKERITSSISKSTKPLAKYSTDNL